jgi:putative FmdB family regulatory protein
MQERSFIMPIYEFICEKCNKPFIEIMSVKEFEKRKIRCPKCKTKKIRQIINSFYAITSKKS